MRIKDLKKRIGLEAAAAAGVLALVFAATYYFSSMFSETERQAQDLQGKINQIKQETTGLRTQLERVQKNPELYDQVMKLSAEERLGFDRQLARAQFEPFKTRFGLTGLKLQIDKIQEMQDAKYKRKSYSIVAGDARVEFSALTDESVYSLLDAIANELTGGTRITRFSMLRTMDVTPATLKDIREKGEASVVGSQIQFSWMGINPVEAPIVGAGGNAAK